MKKRVPVGYKKSKISLYLLIAIIGAIATILAAIIYVISDNESELNKPTAAPIIITVAPVTLFPSETPFFTPTATPVIITVTSAPQFPSVTPSVENNENQLTKIPTNTVGSTFTPVDTFTPALSTPSPTLTLTPALSTPNPTLTIQAAFEEINKQFDNGLKSNIAFNKPSQMKVDETTSIELILHPSLSKAELADQLAEQNSFITSTADPGIYLSPNSEINTIETSQIEITTRMKAVLLSRDPAAFTITVMHDNAEQVVSSVDTTTWRWSVTAKKKDLQTLVLVIYQLVKYDGKEFWHEVETYRADIVVEVNISSWFKSLDWKWIASAILIPLIVAAWSWWRNRKKKAEENLFPPYRRIK